jgi:hypothetical protein
MCSSPPTKKRLSAKPLRADGFGGAEDAVEEALYLRLWDTVGFMPARGWILDRASWLRDAV